MESVTSCSAPSVSVTYGSVDVGMYYPDGKDIKYASMDRASEVVSHMPESARKALLAPIEQGIIDPQSVFYLIDDKCKGQIAICGEDFMQLASNNYSNEENHPREPNGGEDEAVVPPRLLDAWRLLSDEQETEMYSSIDDICSSGYASSVGVDSRSRGESAISAISDAGVSYVPPPPESRPPAHSFSSFTTTTSHGSFINQQNFDVKYFADLDSHASWDGFSSASTRKVSAPELRMPKSSLKIAELTSALSPLQTIHLNSYDSGTHFDEIKTKPTLNHSFNEPEEFQNSCEIKNRQRTWKRFLSFSFYRRNKWTALIIGGVASIFLILSIALILVLKHLAKNETATTKTVADILWRNETYDCVNGSIATVLLDNVHHKLIDLNLSEKPATRFVGSLEYLFVSNLTQWWYALKYCTAWCGHLVSIKGQDENRDILEMVKEHHPQPAVANYWIGLKGWDGSWYLDDESKVDYLNFPNNAQATEDIKNVDNTQKGCVQAERNGYWSVVDCRGMLPFVCERNTAGNIRNTPFAPHQELDCSKVGGYCKYETECIKGIDHTKKHLCPLQASNIVCCVPNKPTPTLLRNATIKNCTEAGGECNHVDADQCRGGDVIFELSKSCPSRPRKYDCCVKNDDN